MIWREPVTVKPRPHQSQNSRAKNSKSSSAIIKSLQTQLKHFKTHLQLGFRPHAMCRSEFYLDLPRNSATVVIQRQILTKQSSPKGSGQSKASRGKSRQWIANPSRELRKHIIRRTEFDFWWVLVSVQPPRRPSWTFPTYFGVWGFPFKIKVHLPRRCRDMEKQAYFCRFRKFQPKPCQLGKIHIITFPKTVEHFYFGHISNCDQLPEQERWRRFSQSFLKEHAANPVG